MHWGRRDMHKFTLCRQEGGENVGEQERLVRCSFSFLRVQVRGSDHSISCQRLSHKSATPPPYSTPVSCSCSRTPLPYCARTSMGSREPSGSDPCTRWTCWLDLPADSHTSPTAPHEWQESLQDRKTELAALCDFVRADWECSSSSERDPDCRYRTYGHSPLTCLWVVHMGHSKLI